MSDNNSELQAKLVIVSEKNRGKEFVLNKERTLIGKDSSCDIVLDSSLIADKAVSIENTKGIYILKSISERKVLVCEESVTEKILEWEDSILIGNIELKFKKTGISKKKKFKKPEISKFIRDPKRARLILVSAILVIALVIIFSPKKSKIHPKIPSAPAKKMPISAKEKQVVETTCSNEELINITANARGMFEIGEKFYKSKNLNSGNLYRAIVVWEKMIESLKNINPRPDIYEKAGEKLVIAKDELHKRIKYLKNNAFAAYKAGRTEDFENILIEIMDSISVPTDKDYIWAKKKFLNIKH